MQRRKWTETRLNRTTATASARWRRRRWRENGHLPHELEPLDLHNWTVIFQSWSSVNWTGKPSDTSQSSDRFREQIITALELYIIVLHVYIVLLKDFILVWSYTMNLTNFTHDHIHCLMFVTDTEAQVEVLKYYCRDLWSGYERFGVLDIKEKDSSMVF
jgi:hypothetical protein